MKSMIELNEKRVLVLMKSINGGKYINKTKFFKSIGVDPSAFNHHLNNIKIKYPEKYEEYVRINEKNRLEFIDNCEQIISNG